MPNKKKQRNAFYFFMKAKQEELAQQGRNISIGQMPQYAHPLWKQMSLAERSKYDKMANEHKLEFNASGRLASDGTLIKENMEEEERKEDLEKQMRQGVIDLVALPGATKEEFIYTISRRKFYIMTFNILCYVEGGTFIPNEVGAVEYSIKDGITAEFHKFIHPGHIPKGYTGEAKRHSEDTHQIPISGHDDSERDYKKIWKELMNFINPQAARSDVPPPVFCLKDDTYQTLGSLEWLANVARAEEIQDIKVWDASYLLMEMRTGADAQLVSYAIAEDLLKKNTFDYIPRTRCSFHEDNDSAHCALGYAKRLCYLFSDAVCHLFEVSMTERHLPLRSHDHKPYEIYIPSFSNFTLGASNERSVGKGLLRNPNNSFSRMESSLSGRTDSSLRERTDSSLRERTDSSLSGRTDNSLLEKTDSNINTRPSSSTFYSNTKSQNASGSDSENSPPSTPSVKIPSRPSTAASGADSSVRLRQPVSMSIALSLARAAQDPIDVPGKGIGRGIRKPK